MKKRSFGVGKYNGVGGKIESDETPEQAMIRETEEEINVTPIKYEKVGIIDFDEYYKDSKQRLAFHLYVVYAWNGIIHESDEMAPRWFNLDEIPYDEMFPADRYWLPLVLKGQKIKAYFNFDKQGNFLNKSIINLDRDIEKEICHQNESDIKDYPKKSRS
jgi:mutator protein MutT